MKFLGWVFRLFKKKKGKEFNWALFTAAALDCANHERLEEKYGAAAVIIFRAG
ncbi:MAG: hypothetical protein WCV41_03580 [Patescibacteria group bacterium]